MSTQIVQIDRFRFVCGLFWQSLSRRHELRAEAIELATRLNFDAMVLRVDRNFAGAGFASTREGAQFGLPSLGALVSRSIATEGAFYDGRQQPAPNWLGAFSLPDDRWAYFAVRDGAFLPNGDWIGSSEEVFERLHNDYSLGGWNVVIGDPSIEGQGFHNFYPRRIQDMIPRRGGRMHVPRWLNLLPVSRRAQSRQLLLIGGGLAAVAVATWAVMAFIHHRDLVAREQAFAMVRARLMLDRLHGKPPPAPPDPWATMPSPVGFVDTCLDRFNMIAPGGWALDSYACRSGNVSYNWVRNGSDVAMLLAVAPMAQPDTTGDHATLVEPVTMPVGGDDRIDGARGARMRMLSAFQLLGLTLRFTAEAPPKQTNDGAAGTKKDTGKASSGDASAMSSAAPPPWQTWHFTAPLGDLSPKAVLQYLDEPGVRLEKLSYQAGQWSLDGVMYEK